ncbi:MAG: hypothetical protein J6Q22_13080 [Prevotella sp.]|nr:hypothetical protein [Prevotella sp.]
MNEANCTQLLEGHSIKPTANRIVVVREQAKCLHPATLEEEPEAYCDPNVTTQQPAPYQSA